MLPHLHMLRGAVLHQDANDNNIVVDKASATVTGLIDLGDMTHGRQINELAVTLAYALLAGLPAGADRDRFAQRSSLFHEGQGQRVEEIFTEQLAALAAGASGRR